MTGPNSSNQNSESVNSQRDEWIVFSQLINEYAKHKLKDKDTRSSYVQDLRAAWSITPEILADIQLFAGKNRKYDGLEIIPEKLNYHALVRETAAFYITLSNNKRAVKDIYLSEYDVNDSLLSTRIDSKLTQLTDQQVEDLLKNEKNRRLFLQDSFWWTLPPEKSIASFLKDLHLEEKYNLIDEEHKIEFYQIVEKIQSWWTIEDIDLETLFESNIYSEKEKERLLNKLVPSISLEQAKRYGIMTDAQATDLKVQHIKENDNSRNKLSDTDIDDIVDQIQDKDIVISTSLFTNNKQNRNTLIDNSEIFRDFAARYNNSVSVAKEKIASGNMQRSSEFVEGLSLISHVQGTEKLREWSILEIKQTIQSWEWSQKEVTLYGEVSSLKDDGVIVFKEKSHDSKYDESGSTVNSETYTDFLSFARWWNPNKWVKLEKITVLTPSDLDAKIRSWEIGEHRWKDLKLEWKDQILSDLASKKQKIDEIEEALNAKEVQMRNDLSGQWLSKEEIQEKIDSDQWVQKYRSDIAELTSQSRERNDKLNNLSQAHKKRLEDEIDELDDAGKKYGFKSGTVLKTKKGDIYTIVNVSEWSQQVVLSSVWHPNEIVSFTEFYWAFEQNETKRINEQAADFSELIDRVKKEDGQNVWDRFELKWSSLKKKNGKWASYWYLVGKREKASKELLQIHDISGDKVTVSFWEIDEKKRKDKKERDVKWADGNTVFDAEFKTEDQSYIVTTGYLEDYIKEHSLEPRSLDEAKDISLEDPNFKKMEKDFRFFSWMFHEKATIADAIKWWNLFFEQMKEMLEMWSEEKANQFALKYMWGVLTADAKRDMQSRLEVKQKSSMDDYIERLEKVASDVALEMIMQWLQDKHSPEFQKEAAVVFMLKKYWVLNAKAMADNEWKWWWYQALWGEYGDELFMELKAEKEAQSLPFTEEFAVYRLIKKQCSPSGYKWVRRRSKLHKEVKKIRAVWKEEEIETGKRDGGDERDVMWRVVGWFEEKITDVMKSFPGSSRIIMMMRFFSYHKDLDLLNNTILHVCDSLQEKSLNGTWFERHSEIGTEAAELFKKIDNPEWGFEKRLKRVEAFYDKYGKDITDVMYMLNTWKEGDKLNKMIFFEKDDETRPERAKVFSQYFDSMKGYMRASETKIDNEDLMTDAFLDAGTSGLDMYKISKELLVMRQGQWKKPEAGPEMWKEVEKEFKAIPHRTYDKDPVKNKEMQMKLLKYNLQCFIAGILRKMQNGNEIAGYNKPAGPFNILNKWWIDMTNFDDIKWFSVDDLLYGRHAATNDQITKFADNIMNVELNGATYYHEIDNVFSKEDTSVDTIGSSVQTKAAQALSNPSSWPSFTNDPTPQDPEDYDS